LYERYNAFKFFCLVTIEYLSLSIQELEKETLKVNVKKDIFFAKVNMTPTGLIGNDVCMFLLPNSMDCNDFGFLKYKFKLV
jgi:hypothetical protein